ncbi:hypothetical protein Tco_0120936 [Tanacetum coccineum]
MWNNSLSFWEIKELKKHVHELEIELSGDFPPKISPQHEGELIKKDKGKKAMSSKDAKDKGIESEYDDDANLTGPMGESSKKKKMKKFDVVIEGGDRIHLTEEQIKEQKRIEESVKAELAKQELEVGKEELVDLLGIDVMKGFYKAKLQYDKYCDKMLNRRVQSRITNCNVLTRKGHITLKVYREDGTNEIIIDFKASDLNLSEWIETRMDCLHKTEAKLKIDFNKPFSEQDPLDKLNDLARKKRTHVDDIHDYFRSTKKFKSSIQYEDHPAKTMLNESCLEIYFRLHQGLGLDDHAMTFSSLLLAEADKRNLNKLKQIRTIE